MHTLRPWPQVAGQFSLVVATQTHHRLQQFQKLACQEVDVTVAASGSS